MTNVDREKEEKKPHGMVLDVEVVCRAKGASPGAAQLPGKEPVKSVPAKPMYCRAGKAPGAPQLIGKLPASKAASSLVGRACVSEL